MQEYMNVAIFEARKSLEKEDIPVGAIIIKNNQIIAQAHNEKEYMNIATKHAEIIAIEKACDKLKTWYLDDCILVTTMEPCMMCCGAIIQARIKKVIYGVRNEKYGCCSLLNEKYKIECCKYEDDKEIIKMLRNFFKERR
ncbi:MAG: nucleoside deaminase [Bacilli bacterium]|nr:nucleoside deaminase [Bacilli bacterium]